MFERIKKATLTNSHGEMNFLRIEEGNLPDEGWGDFTEKTQSGDFIIGHSESGHHHILDADGVQVMERESDGFKVLKAIVTKPTALRQDASTPHERQIVEPGTYIITTSREKPFFQEQARRVAD